MKYLNKFKIPIILVLGVLFSTTVNAQNFNKITVRFLVALSAAKFTGTLTVGAAGSGKDVQLFSDTSGDHFLWDSSAEALTIIGTDGQDALNIDDGNVDIADNVDIDGVLTTDGINKSVIVVTDAATYTILAANTGIPHMITDLSQNSDFDFPAEAAGLYFPFYYVGGAAEAHDHTFDTEADVNFFIGGVSFLDTDAGSGADEVHVGLYSDGNSNSKFTVNNLAAGSQLTFWSDGTNWYISGQIMSDTVPAFADQ